MNPRFKRLYGDYARVGALFEDHPRIRIAEVIGDPPTRYIVEYRVKTLIETKDGIKEADFVRVQIVLGENYPKDMPICSVLDTPVFHPNIDPTSICTQDVSNAAVTLDDVIVFIGRELCYQAYNPGSPKNGDARVWALANKDRFPLEDVELIPRAKLEGRDHLIPIPSFEELSARLNRNRVAPKCANCAADSPESGVSACAVGHLTCSDCRIPCPGCKRDTCLLCPMAKCSQCGTTACNECVSQCAVCRAAVRDSSRQHACGNCGADSPELSVSACAAGHLTCSDCRVACPGCRRDTCLLCPAAKCSQCGSMVCNECASRCANCGSTVCRKDLEPGGYCPACATRPAPPRQREEAAAPIPQSAMPSRTSSAALAFAETEVIAVSAPQRPGWPASPRKPAPAPAAYTERTLVKPGPIKPSIETISVAAAPDRSPPAAAAVVITADEVYRVPPSALVIPNPQIRLHAEQAPPFSGKAIAALAFGVAGLPAVGLLTGWFAIWFGAMALRQIKRSKEMRGRGLAISGIILGVVDVVVWIVLGLSWAASRAAQGVV